MDWDVISFKLGKQSVIHLSFVPEEWLLKCNYKYRIRVWSLKLCCLSLCSFAFITEGEGVYQPLGSCYDLCHWALNIALNWDIMRRAKALVLTRRGSLKRVSKKIIYSPVLLHYKMSPVPFFVIEMNGV